MKNIHVLTTEKFSNLILQTNGELRLSELELRGQVGNGFTQHIYITSDEEIKVGDWFAVELFKITGESRGLHIEKCIKLNDIWCNDFDVVSTRHKGNCNKIILTTDQDLIKDGVQAIKDEFLEWFVKNPSCERVEIVFNNRGITGAEKILKTFGDYKIIIPKEKSKQDLPNKLESVLAKITNQNDLGLSQWYEVVYYSDGKWCSYSGSKTFEDGERVVEWKYCKYLI